MDTAGLPERKKQILRAIVEEYIEHAEPVGSKVVSERAALGVSAATIRNEMAELENMGYLDQPHTSAGRIPSHKGYRLYVDELMRKPKLSESEAQEIGAVMQRRLRELDNVITGAARMLSDLTKYAALALAPHMSGDVIRKIDVFACGENVYVFVMVSAGGLVNNKLMRVAQPVEPDDVKSLTAALNDVFVGVSPSDITLRQVRVLESRAGSARELLAAIMEYIKDISAEYAENELRVDGAVNLLYHPEFQDLDKARELIKFLDETDDTRWVAPKAGGDDAVDIRIGSETQVRQLEQSSLVVADVRLANHKKGYIGIIGPTRMDYARVAARLRYMADILGRMIDDT